MSRKRRVDISVDELFAMIERSTLPTVVEGSDDIIIFRRLEQLFVINLYPFNLLAEGDRY